MEIYEIKDKGGYLLETDNPRLARKLEKAEEGEVEKIADRFWRKRNKERGLK